jgi:16S rRNA U1498 N3-methylase RsmE
MRRFWVPEALQAGAVVTFSDALQHRLRHVLRLGAGDVVGLWNGRDGWWEARLNDDKARAATVGQQRAAQPLAHGPVVVVGLAVIAIVVMGSFIMRRIGRKRA